MAMKPFDLEAAKRGEPLVTRDGRKATFVAHTPQCAVACRVWVHVEGEASLLGFYENGLMSPRREDGWDLFMAPKTRTLYVNLYCSDFGYSTGSVFDSAEKSEMQRVLNNDIKFVKAISFEVKD